MRSLTRLKARLRLLFAERANLNLLTPLGYMEIQMQISPNGTRRLYTSKAETQEQANALIQHMLHATFELAKHYGIEIKMGPPPGGQP